MLFFPSPNSELLRSIHKPLDQRVQHTECEQSFNRSHILLIGTPYLLSLSDCALDTESFELDLPKGQLAALLGTIPETLSRVFYQLTQERVIEMTGTMIRVCDRDRVIELSYTHSKNLR